MTKLESRTWFIVDLRLFLISLSFEKLLSHDAPKTHKIKKSHKAKMRFGTESKNSYSSKNSKNVESNQETLILELWQFLKMF